MKKPVILLMGPTASGKTALAIEAAQRFPVDIISVDSAMIYRGMDIGTAKPSEQELQQAPHRLIDICSPLEAYSVAQFSQDALAEIQQSHAQNRIPLLVGGTMMYYHALLQGLSELPETNAQIRAQLLARLADKGLADLHAQLTQIDPDAASRIHENDTQRTLRALEVYESTGKTQTELHGGMISPLADYDVLAFAIETTDRAVLHKRIATRFRAMLTDGFIDEVKQLQALPGLHADLPAMRCVGYRQVWQYLTGEFTATEMEERGIIATRQLAKRQLTWLRNWKSPLQWISLEDRGAFLDQLESLVGSDVLSLFLC